MMLFYFRKDIKMQRTKKKIYAVYEKELNTCTRSNLSNFISREIDLENAHH